MISVTSLELSKRLYELSGWGFTEFYENARYNSKPDIDQFYERMRLREVAPNEWTDWGVTNWENSKLMKVKWTEVVPAYDCSYLLRKLPNDVILKKQEDGDYRAYAPKTVPTESVLDYTPEDALCLLAIKLFEQGILKKEERC